MTFMEILSNSKRLEKDVQIAIHKRPIKIVFFISEEETEKNHLILDEIFKYAYTCWAGAKFLIVPLNSDEDEYLKWLDFYDADIVYSYIKLTNEQINKIENINSPALLIEHYFGEKGKYISVNISSYNPIKSISTIHSLNIYNHRINDTLKIITQLSPEKGERFITDNFGNRLEVNTYLHELKGVYETYCLTNKSVTPNNYMGTKLVNSISEVIQILSDQEAITVARLASIHSEAIAVANHYAIKNSFSLIVGSSIKDRISFWNSRLFYDTTDTSECSLIITEEQSNDDNFLMDLGKYLNSLNSLRPSSSGPSQVSIFSQTISEENLIKFSEKLRKFTYNSIQIPNYFSKRIIPTHFSEFHFLRSIKNDISCSISEIPSFISISGPNHLRHIPSKFHFHGTGDFSTEFNIDRHNNLSMFSNVVDKWLLPRRAYIANIFGSNFERISKNKLLVSLRGKSLPPFRRSADDYDFKIEIFLPRDLILLNRILASKNNYKAPDCRAILEKSKIDYIEHSDKGKNFSGVISLFKELYIATDFLTNILWKDVFQDASTRNKKEDYLYSLKSLKGFQQKHRNSNFINNITSQFDFKKTSHASQYLTACFKDAISDLVKYKVFHPVYTWSCKKCGYKNLKTVDSIKLKNNCDICEESHHIPIDEEFSWEYLLNKFVHRVMFEHNGLPVLWALRYIQNLSYFDSFLYLPEVNIYYNSENSNKLNEIDLIGIFDGNLFAGEAKRSADYFLSDDRETNKFLELIEHIMPDQAFLIFDQYSENDINIEKTKDALKEFRKIFNKKFNNIKLTILTFEDFLDSSSPVIDYGVQGDNVYSFIKRL